MAYNPYNPYVPVMYQQQPAFVPATGQIQTGYAPGTAQQQPAFQPQSNQGGGILWVQGEEGAKAYMVAPGASVMLMDSERQAFYIKSADSSGMPTPLRVFDYTERTAVPAAQSLPAAKEPGVEYATMADIDALRGRIDDLEHRKDGRRDGKPSVQPAQQRQ